MPQPKTISDCVYDAVDHAENLLIEVPDPDKLIEAIGGLFDPAIGACALTTACHIGPVGARAISRALDVIDDESPDDRLCRLSAIWGSTPVHLVLVLRHRIMHPFDD